MDQVRERTVTTDLSYPRFNTPSYIGSALNPSLNSAAPLNGAAPESLSLSEILLRKLLAVSDLEVGAAYRDVLSAVENDRRRRTLERSRQAYESVLHWIDANVAGTLELDAISRGSRQSSAAIRRLIREHNSQSIASFIRSRRIDAALSLLAASSKRLAMIAAECGFASQSHFSRSIRAETGVTPSQYRKRSAQIGVVRAS